MARHCGPGRLEEGVPADEDETAGDAAGGGAGGGGGLSSRGLRGLSIMPPMSESDDLKKSSYCTYTR